MCRGTVASPVLNTEKEWAFSFIQLGNVLHNERSTPYIMPLAINVTPSAFFKLTCKISNLHQNNVVGSKPDDVSKLVHGLMC